MCSKINTIVNLISNIKPCCIRRHIKVHERGSGKMFPECKLTLDNAACILNISLYSTLYTIESYIMKIVYEWHNIVLYLLHILLPFFWHLTEIHCMKKRIPQVLAKRMNFITHYPIHNRLNQETYNRIWRWNTRCSQAMQIWLTVALYKMWYELELLTFLSVNCHVESRMKV